MSWFTVIRSPISRRAPSLSSTKSQEAVFFRNGQMLDSYESGRYTLESEDFPYIGREFKWASGKKSPFHAEVYFVNKADCMTVLWGTPSPILIQDPEYDVILPIQGQRSVYHPGGQRPETTGEAGRHDGSV